MTEFQTRIYDGLKAIGPEIANFYLDGLRLLDPTCTLGSRANLIAHMAREIDSSFRDVFAPKPEKKAKEAELGGNNAHLASILVALGKEKDDELAKKWVAIATQFAKIAHHTAAHLPSKETETIIGLWADYERVLILLVGSFYAIADRLKRMVSFKEPDDDALAALRNMLRHTNNERYFFLELKQLGWLQPLQKEGYFSVATVPPKPVDSYGANRWPQLAYLLAIAPTAKTDPIKMTFVGVIDDIVNGYLADQLYLDQFMVSVIARILVEAPELSFSATCKGLFEKACVEFNVAHLFYTSTLTEQLPRKILDQKDTGGLMNLLSYVVDFHVHYENEKELRELGFSPIARIAENVDVMHLGAFAGTYGPEVVGQLKGEAIKTVLAQIHRLNDTDPTKFSSFVIPSIEPSDQSQYATEWENKLVEVFVQLLLQLERPELSDFVQSFIYSPIQILTRIAFHAIRTRYEDLSDIFWSYVASRNLTDDIYIHEVHLLLEEKSPEFDDTQFGTILHWIESKDTTTYKDQSKADAERLHYHSIRRWLTALKPRSDSQIRQLADLRDPYDAKDNSPISHPSFISYMTIYSGYDTPIDQDKFDQMTVDQQAAYCTEFKPKEAHTTSLEGLGNILSACITRNPSKYYYSLDLFAQLPLLYIYHILYGVLNAIRGDLMTDHSLLILFVEGQLNSAGFNQEDEKGAVRNWVVGGIADLFGEIASRREQFTFKEEELQSFHAILIRLLEDKRFRNDRDDLIADVTTHILNSTQGKLHRALMESTLVWADLYAKEKEVKWPNPVRDYFAGRLREEGEADKDFAMSTGYYLGWLLYLDKTWANGHYAQIFNTGNETKLKHTLWACFSLYQRITGDLYDFFKSHDTFGLGLSFKDNPTSSLDAIMRYAVFEYRFRAIEPGDSASLLRFVIDSRKEIHFLRLIQVIKDVDLLKREQILIVWRIILSVANEDEQRFRNVSYSMVAFLDIYRQLDKDVAPLLEETVSHFTEMTQASNYLIRLLCKYGTSDLEIAARLVLQLLRTVNAIPYADKEFQKLTDAFYKNKLKDRADAICLFFADKGNFFLKEVYDRYNTAG